MLGGRKKRNQGFERNGKAVMINTEGRKYSKKLSGGREKGASPKKSRVWGPNR